VLGGSVWLSLNVWTAPVGLIWHSIHGRSIIFDGHTVDVPWDMWVENSSAQSLMIIREAPKYPLQQLPAGTIIIQRGSGRAADMSKDYDRIVRADETPPKGYRLQGTRRLFSEKGTAYCWELARTDASHISISCWFDKDTLVAWYEGSPLYRDRFYRVLAAATGASEQPSS